MLTSVLVTSLYVLDQQEALDFYVGKLGLEIKNDIPLGFMRWLTVGVPGENREILLELPGPPAHNEATATQVRDLVTKGAGGGWIGFVTDDCRRTYEELSAKGVEITQEPLERPYGIDMGLRDPFGNQLRISELRPMEGKEYGR
jgi:catechol 2,3-dioxygenase-like lactoylglutathione lyase family enzyme